MSMPWQPDSADADGAGEEGAALGLLDTTGAMAAWAVTGPGPSRASTAGIQAQILAPLSGVARRCRRPR